MDDIPYQDTIVIIQGLVDARLAELLVHLCSVEVSHLHLTISPEVPNAIETLLKEYTNVFSAPPRLPPKHSCDHVVPLVPSVESAF